jgi:hypothetical protein
MQKTTICIVSFALCCCSTLFCQSNTISAGGDATGVGGTAAYTFGQVAYTQHTGNGGSINLGVQQTYTIDEVNNFNELGELISIYVGPNPSADLFTIHHDGSADLFLTITDANGKIISEPQPLKNTQQINMQEWSQGMYLLQFTQFQTPIKQIKLIKH